MTANLTQENLDIYGNADIAWSTPAVGVGAMGAMRWRFA